MAKQGNSKATGTARDEKGTADHIEARIVAVADVFDALTTKRPYKDAWSVEQAVAWLKSQRGAHFDPEIIDLLDQVIPAFLEVRERWKET